MTEKIGKYELIDRIGGGSFGLVYRSFDPLLKRTVAIKVCTSRDETTRLRFYREAEIAGNLIHPAIATVHDFGFHGDVPFLVEEYLSGEDLDQKLRREAPVTLSQKLDYLVQLADGLAYAHGQGVVHRDIKPSNLRVLHDDTLKVLDFGTAKRTGGDSRLTQTGTTVGTAAYLSPEILKGKEASPASDVFALGVVGYELLTGRRPFPGKRVHEVLSQILDLEPEPISHLWPACPGELETVLRRCLEKEPGDRFATCGEIAGRLRSVGVERLADAAAAPLAEPDASLDVPGLLARTRDLQRSGDLPAALLPLATAESTGQAGDEAGTLRSGIVEGLRRKGLLPTEKPSRAVADPGVHSGLVALKATLYVGDVEGVERLVRKHRAAFVDQAARSQLVSEVVPRLRTMATALRSGVDLLVEDALHRARTLLAARRGDPAIRLLRTVRGLGHREGEIDQLLHVAAAATRSHTTMAKHAEVAGAVGALLERGELVRAAEALAFAQRLHREKLPLAPLYARIADHLRHRVDTLRVAAAALVMRVERETTERPHDRPELLELVSMARDLEPENPELEATQHSLRRDLEAIRLVHAAKELAAAGKSLAALESLVEAARIAPRDDRVARLLARACETLTADE